jgi:copper homeostasis protein
MDLEICVDSVEAAIAAECGGAQRIELCSALVEGGLTPSLGLIRAVRSRVGIGIYVMIRPRGGDFLYSSHELAVMKEDIAVVAECGVEGVVFGLLTAGGDVDVERTRALVDAARPMEVTFHRAIDMARDMEQALEDVISAGAVRILTSGGEQSAVLGSERIGRLVRAAEGRAQIMVGGGVRAENVRDLIEATGASSFHSAASSKISSPVEYQAKGVHLGDPGIDDYQKTVVRVEDVRKLRQAMDPVFSTNGRRR